MNITPVGERVILKPVKAEEKTKGGIYIPESAKEEKKEAVVISVGTDKNGKKLPLNEGDKVIYGGYGYNKIKVNDEEYIIIDFKDILAKIG